jgi:ParB family transcriptional regulator, chromosome partitioning protein
MSVKEAARQPSDNATLEAELIERLTQGGLTPLEDVRTLARLKALGLTHGQIGERVGRGESTVGNMLRILDLSEEILGFIERGELRLAHGLALLVAKDPAVRAELARRAVAEGWTIQGTTARAREVNDDHRRPRAQRAREPCLDEDLQALARLWGDVLGVEVGVRPMAYGQLRLEVTFNSAGAGAALAERLKEEA